MTDEIGALLESKRNKTRLERVSENAEKAEKAKVSEGKVKIDEDNIMMDIQDILGDMSIGAPGGMTLEDYLQAIVATAADYNLERTDMMKDDLDPEDYEDGMSFYKKALKANIKVKI